jgi:hypothetical protein
LGGQGWAQTPSVAQCSPRAQHFPPHTRSGGQQSPEGISLTSGLQMHWLGCEPQLSLSRQHHALFSPSFALTAVQHLRFLPAPEPPAQELSQPKPRLQVGQLSGGPVVFWPAQTEPPFAQMMLVQSPLALLASPPQVGSAAASDGRNQGMPTTATPPASTPSARRRGIGCARLRASWSKRASEPLIGRS